VRCTLHIKQQHHPLDGRQKTKVKISTATNLEWYLILLIGGDKSAGGPAVGEGGAGGRGYVYNPGVGGCSDGGGEHMAFIRAARDGKASNHSHGPPKSPWTR
jgi:hypothetical protein